MNDFAVNAFVVFLICILCTLFYWIIVHPVLLKGLQFRLFARRDKLRSDIIQSGGVTPSHRHLEGFICKAISVVPAISLLKFAIYSLSHKTEPDEPSLQFQRESSVELKVMNHDTIRDCILIMMLNSPITFICAAVVVFVLWVSGKLARLYYRAEKFVGTLPDAKAQMA